MRAFTLFLMSAVLISFVGCGQTAAPAAPPPKEPGTAIKGKETGVGSATVSDPKSPD